VTNILRKSTGSTLKLMPKIHINVAMIICAKSFEYGFMLNISSMSPVINTAVEPANNEKNRLLPLSKIKNDIKKDTNIAMPPHMGITRLFQRSFFGFATKL